MKSPEVKVSGLFMVADGRKPFIAGNWKMNPTTIEEAHSLASKVKELTKGRSEIDIALFAPYPFIYTAKKAVDGSSIMVGAQSVYFEEKGAFTGAVSTGMIKTLGGHWILAGHSERRASSVLYRMSKGDDDFSINLKVKKILSSGLGCLLCIGESEQEYKEGLNKEICTVQLAKDLMGVTAEQMAKVVIAYEPVWAIGTGLTCPSDVAQSVHASIRSWIEAKYGKDVAKATRIQYGGSVTPETIDELMACPDIDGALVGGASLAADKFARICNYVKL